MFIRIVHDKPIDGVGYRARFLDAAYALRSAPMTSDSLSAALSAAIDWFKANLDVPGKFSRTSSKGAWRRNTKGLSWFRPGADVHIAKAFEVRALLASGGIETEVLRTDRVGYVTYEDEFQIVAEPFSDTPT